MVRRVSNPVASVSLKSDWLTTVTPAIELLRLSGFNPIITTASPRNTDYLLKTVGATHVLDRNLSPDALQAEIRKIMEKPIKTVYDAVGTPETQTLGYDLLAPGGVLAYVQPQPISPEKLVPDKKAFFVFGDLSIPRNRKLGVSLYSYLTELLATGALKASICGTCGIYGADVISEAHSD